MPLVLEYTARPGCPGPDRFLGDVAARTSLLRRARPDEPSITLTVVIEKVAGGDKGTLKLESTDGATSARQVSAADCEQVVSALALMTALALDPNASTAPVPPPPTPAEPPPRDAVAKAQPVPVPPPTRWRMLVGVAFEALGGVKPGALFLVRPTVELGSSSASAWSSALRLSVGVGSGAVTQDAGGAEFTLLAGRVEACPARWRASPALQLSPCLALDAGRLEVTGTGVTPAERVAPAWVAAGAVARLEWEITDTIVVDIAGELLCPFTRDRYFVNDDLTLHRTPSVALGAAAGLGARFP